MRVLGLVVASFVIFKFVLLPVRVSGISMQPTYRDGTCCLVNRLAFRWKPPQRGDVVLIRTTGMHKVFMKRIVGLPHETLRIEDGVIMINDQPLPEPYVKVRLPWEEPAYVLAADEYFVLGDNRATEEWSHRGGPVPREKIVGKLLW
jgi:signal peptidase I